MICPDNEPVAEEIASLQGPAKGHGDASRQPPHEKGTREELAALCLECEIVTHLRAETLEASGWFMVVLCHLRCFHRSRAPRLGYSHMRQSLWVCPRLKSCISL